MFIAMNPQTNTVLRKILGWATSSLERVSHHLPTGIDQGYPLSPLSFSYYKSDPVENDQNKSTLPISIHDDIILFSRGKTSQEANRRMMKPLTSKNGALSWETTHHSLVEIDKAALLGFTHRREPTQDETTKTEIIQCPLSIVQGQTITPQKRTEYLEVILDNELRSHECIALVSEKDTKWEIALRKICLVHRPYVTVAIPHSLCTADIFMPRLLMRRKHEDFTRRREIGPIAKFTGTRRRAALAATAIMRSTATDTVGAHVNHLPFHLLIRNLCSQASVRDASLPASCSPGKTGQRAKQMQGESHRSPLQIASKETEKKTLRMKQPHEKRLFAIHIKDRVQAKAIMAPSLQEAHIYTDGSGIEGKIGAAATTINQEGTSKSLRYQLRSTDHHAVYEADITGLILAIHIAIEWPSLKRLTIFTDCMQVVRALDSKSLQSRLYHFSHLESSFEKLHQKDNGIEIDICWVPAHSGVIGNERADSEAKMAAKLGSSPATRLPEILQRKLASSMSNLKN